MAKILLEYPYSAILGKINKRDKRGVVQRQKKFRDLDGNIIGTAKLEGYTIQRPRNYKVNPLQGEQLANVTTFQKAVALAKAERANPERMAYWTERWKKQLKKGETDAPIDPSTHRHRIYVRLDIFIQTVILRELKKGE